MNNELINLKNKLEYKYINNKNSKNGLLLFDYAIINKNKKETVYGLKLFYFQENKEINKIIKEIRKEIQPYQMMVVLKSKNFIK